MDVDRFFTFGPETPFQAHEVFTDREQYIAAYSERVRTHRERSWSDAELTNFQRSAHNIMAVVGEGGIGKSALLRHLARLTQDGKLSGLPKHRAVALIDFADPDNQSFEAVLWRVRAAVGRLARSWPAFDIAFALYWERKGGTMADLARWSAHSGHNRELSGLGQQIVETAGDLLDVGGLAGIGYRLASLATRGTARTARVRRLKREAPTFQVLIAERDAGRMLGYLPALLGYDLEQIRRKKPAFALCVLDTLEQTQGLRNERGGVEDLVSRLVYLLPNMFFLAASRRPLLWHDPVHSVGLTYGGEHRWPGLAGRHGKSDQLPVDGFDVSDADAYLRDRLTRGDQAAIPEPVRRRIIGGSSGSPHYLELSVELFQQIAARGEQPEPELFGRPFPQLALRIMRDLSPEERDILRAAALLEAFDEEILAVVIPGMRGRHAEALLRRRFVRHTPDVWPQYRLHEVLREGVMACDAHSPDGWTATERRRGVLRAVGYLEDLVLSIWREDEEHPLTPRERNRRVVAAFLLALHAAAEHDLLPLRLGHMAYTLRELGHVQVLTSLPDYADRAPDLQRLTAVARLGARTDLGAKQRYEEMKAVAGDLTGTYYGSRQWRSDLAGCGGVARRGRSRLLIMSL